ncbi:MAG: hypothetical protein FJY75_04550 [Candidatus Eisenbacteria bacterium]|uniref:Capsule assembly Wzi family protein n=1 Tax=Eiseniibacteriota bacterium TaxID=2212470 RepID=A0A937X7R1_UNCEI|nr:hypothetical protein [Candidatus Eisenbacteria bacterium]
MLRRRLACAGALLALGLVPAGAQATVREWRMDGAGIDPGLIGSLPSARLSGMGAPSLAVPDESNEFNTHDFAGNVAGILEDGDGWVIDAWTGNALQNQKAGFFEAERRYGHAGFRAVQRSEQGVLGAEVNWAFFQDSAPRDWTKVRGPLMSAIVNRRFGPVTVGAIVGLEQEKEDRVNPEFFSLAHRQDRWIGQFGAMTRLRGVELSAGWSFEAGDVVGLSVDPARFHEDTYTWSRPLHRYTLALILPRSGSLEGGVRAGWMERDGFERVRVSWSDDSPQNPSRSFYEAEAITFAEAVSDLQVSTAWRLHLGGAGVLGFGGALRAEEDEVEEGVNFKGSRRAGRMARDTVAAGVGFSRRFAGGRLLGFCEGMATLQDWETEEPAAGSAQGRTRVVSATAGLEYFAAANLMLRAGATLSSVDRELDAPATLSLGQAWTGGISWLPSGGLVQLHGAVRVERSRSADEAVTSIPEVTDLGYSVSARLLP